MFVPKLVVCVQEGYSWRSFRSDLGSGLVVGLVALPLAMAFAIASGVPPAQGLYTAVAAGFLVSALGGSRVQIGGPTGAFVVIVAGIVAQHGYAGLAMATMMAGAILVVMGLSRLGALVKFIPYPVTTGFTSGIAVVIFSSQIKDLLGLRMGPVPADFIERWRAFAAAFPSINPYAAAVSALTVLLIASWPKRWQKIPGSMVALALATAATQALGLPLETIGSRFGGIPQSLPEPSWPALSWSQIKPLFPAATTIAMLAAIESLLSAVVADGMIGGRHKSNLELVAQGIANIASPVFGGIPAAGAIARTATNVRNGGRTPVAGIVHAVALLLILLAAGPLAAGVPLAALAGILLVVSYQMSEWRSFRLQLAGPRSDVVVLLTTFFLTVFVDLTTAVEVGLVLAAFLFMRHMADITQVRALTGEGSAPADEGPRRLPVPRGVEVFSVHGTFFFGAAHKLMETRRIVDGNSRALVLDMADVLHMDASGLHALEQMRRQCRARGTRFVIAGIHSQPLVVVQRAGRVELFGEENFYADLASALRALDAGDAAEPAGALSPAGRRG